MGWLFPDPQLDRIEAAQKRILTVLAGIEHNQEVMMSRTDDALNRLAAAAVSAVQALQHARADAQAAQARADQVVAADAAEDQAQFEAIDTSTSAAIDSATQVLIDALSDPDVPAEPPAPPTETGGDTGGTDTPAEPPATA